MFLLRDLGALFGQQDIFVAALLGAVLLILLTGRQWLSRRCCSASDSDLADRAAIAETHDRYTFQYEYLYAGFNLIVVIIGIFAICWHSTC